MIAFKRYFIGQFSGWERLRVNNDENDLGVGSIDINMVLYQWNKTDSVF